MSWPSDRRPDRSHRRGRSPHSVTAVPQGREGPARARVRRPGPNRVTAVPQGRKGPARARVRRPGPTAPSGQQADSFTSTEAAGTPRPALSRWHAGSFTSDATFSKGYRHFASGITLAERGITVKAEVSLRKRTPASRTGARNQALGQVNSLPQCTVTYPNALRPDLKPHRKPDTGPHKHHHGRSPTTAPETGHGPCEAGGPGMAGKPRQRSPPARAPRGPGGHEQGAGARTRTRQEDTSRARAQEPGHATKTRAGRGPECPRPTALPTERGLSPPEGP